MKNFMMIFFYKILGYQNKNGSFMLSDKLPISLIDIISPINDPEIIETINKILISTQFYNVNDISNLITFAPGTIFPIAYNFPNLSEWLDNYNTYKNRYKINKYINNYIFVC